VRQQAREEVVVGVGESAVGSRNMQQNVCSNGCREIKERCACGTAFSGGERSLQAFASPVFGRTLSNEHSQYQFSISV
jgi:hypothetical protein